MIKEDKTLFNKIKDITYTAIPFIGYISIIIMFFNLLKQSPDKYEYIFIIFIAEFLSIHSNGMMGMINSTKIKALILMFYMAFVLAIFSININAGIVLFISLLSKVLNKNFKFTHRTKVNTVFFVLSIFITFFSMSAIFKENDINLLFIYWGIFYYFGMIAIEIWSIFSNKDDKVVEKRPNW